MQAITRLLSGVVVLLALGAVELAARPRTFVAGQGVRMKTEVPAGYSFKTETNQHGLTQVTLENPVWRIAMVAIISPEYTAACNVEEWQKNLVVTQSAEILAQSKEQDYKFTALNPSQGSGVYCIFSDPEMKRPEDLQPDEYNHLVAGAKVIPGAVMYFRILCNDLKSPEYQEALAVFVNSFDEA